MNKDKRVAIHKVRVYFSKRPFDIRSQRDLSPKEYKRKFYVANDSNYIMGIYVGKEKRDFKLINRKDAAKYYNSGISGQGADMLRAESKNGYPLKWKLKIGTMVLLYEETPEEIYELDEAELCKRLYKITGMHSSLDKGYIYGFVSLVHHQEARSSEEIPTQKGRFKCGEIFRPRIDLCHTQFKALVQGYDFEMDDLGKIKFKNR